MRRRRGLTLAARRNDDGVISALVVWAVRVRRVVVEWRERVRWQRRGEFRGRETKDQPHCRTADASAEQEGRREPRRLRAAATPRLGRVAVREIDVVVLVEAAVAHFESIAPQATQRARGAAPHSSL